MALFDFLKDVGAQILGKGSDDGAAIKNHITQAFGGKIKDLEVIYDDGKVTLSGVAASQAQKEKAILVAGNVRGVAKVDGSGLMVAEESTAASASGSQEQPRFYTIKKGDTLSRIAKEVYKDPNKYQTIFEANREVILDPDKIYPGQQIRIPQASAH